MFKKLKSQRGETLIEALVAILVVVVSGLTLYFAVITAARVNAAASAADTLFHLETNAAEQQGSVASTGKITITGSGISKEADVSYTGGAGQLTSYKLGSGGGS